MLILPKEVGENIGSQSLVVAVPAIVSFPHHVAHWSTCSSPPKTTTGSVAGLGAHPHPPELTTPIEGPPP